MKIVTEVWNCDQTITHEVIYIRDMHYYTVGLRSIIFGTKKWLRSVTNASPASTTRGAEQQRGMGLKKGTWTSAGARPAPVEGRGSWDALGRTKPSNARFYRPTNKLVWSFENGSEFNEPCVKLGNSLQNERKRWKIKRTNTGLQKIITTGKSPDQYPVPRKHGICRCKKKQLFLIPVG